MYAARGTDVPYPSIPNTRKKGFFGKLKDKATGKGEVSDMEKKIWNESEAGRRLQAQVSVFLFNHESIGHPSLTRVSTDARTPSTNADGRASCIRRAT
jgi:hypothetical protein